jgi:hypothetical protein
MHTIHYTDSIKPKETNAYLQSKLVSNSLFFRPSHEQKLDDIAFMFYQWLGKGKLL